MEEAKYIFTDEKLELDDGTVLHRVEALKDFADVKKGDRSGWIERPENLSQSGNAWVSDNALVYGNACVYGDAWVYGNARVYGNACVYGDACVSGDAWVYGNAWETSPLQIQSTGYFVNMATATELQIGCQCHTLEWWLEKNEAHAAEEGDTPEYAAEMRLYIELACRRYAPELLEKKQ